MKKSAVIFLSVFLILSVFAMSFMMADDSPAQNGSQVSNDNVLIAPRVVAGNSSAAVNSGAGEDNRVRLVCCSITPVVPNASSNYVRMAALQCSNVINGHPRLGADLKIVDDQFCTNNTRSEYENGRRVQANEQIQNNNGSVIVSIQRTVTYANGTTETYNISINTQNRTQERTMEMEREGAHYNVSIQRGLNVSSQFFGNRSQIIANLSNGRQVNISVLPDQALAAALARLRAMNQTMNQTNASIQLRERIQNNVPMVVYNVQANQDGKFLGIFKIAMKANAEVDASNGTVVSVGRPWWAFLVSLPPKQPPENSANGTSAAPMIPAPAPNGTSP